MRRLISVSLLLTLFSTALAQAQQCADPASTMVWKVEGIDHDVHLMGSVHVGKPDFYPLPAVVEELIQGADNLVFEIDPAEMNNLRVQTEILSRGMLPPGETLAAQISPATLERLRKVIAETGLSEPYIMQMRPWMVVNILSLLQVQKEGFRADMGTENYVLVTRGNDTPVLQLETLQDQLGYLYSMDSEAFIISILDSFGDESVDTLNAMMEAWKCGDHRQLEQVVMTEFSDPDLEPEWQAEMARIEEILLFDRNRIMADGIKEFITTGQGSYLVVVGSAHLLGERSVIDLLRGDGYVISPVRQP